MKGDPRKASQREMREETGEMIAAMSDAELANCAIMNAQNLSLEPELRQSINLELREEIARRKAAQEEGEQWQKLKEAM